MNALTITGSNDIFTMIAGHPKLADSTKAQYSKAVANYLDCGHSLADPHALSAYAATVSASTQSFLRSVLKLWAKHMAKGVKGQADGTQETVAKIQSTLWQLEAIADSIEPEKPKGNKTHTWLSPNQMAEMLSRCDESLKGRRDRVLLSLLLGTGVRRAELVSLEFSNIITQGDAMVLQVKGKGGKERSISLGQRLIDLLEDWHRTTGDGHIVRGMTRTKELNGSMSGVAVYKVVNHFGRLINVPDLAPHDLRRSFAETLRQAGVELEQISILLGHSSLQVTMRYFNIRQDMGIAASDYLPL